MSSNSAAATKLSSPTAGALPTAGSGPEASPERVSRARRAAHPVKAAYARSAAERRIEAALGFATIYALGAADGPDVDRLKLGVATSARALSEEIRKAQHYNGRRMVVTMRAHLVGKEVGLRLKADVGARLAAEGRHLHGSWYRIGAEQLSALTSLSAYEMRVELIDDAGRQRRVLDTVEREMERVVRGERFAT